MQPNFFIFSLFNILLQFSFLIFHFFVFFFHFSFSFFHVLSCSFMFFHVLSCSLLGAQNLIFWCLNFVTISLDISFVKNHFLGPSREVEKKTFGPSFPVFLFFFTRFLSFFLLLFFSFFSFFVHFFIF